MRRFRKALQEVNALLQTNSFTGSVLSQTVSDDDELKTLAQTYGITPGKAQLVQQLIRQNTLYTFEELSRLSVNELNLLIAANNTPLENTEVVGNASDKSYIGADKAKEIALSMREYPLPKLVFPKRNWILTTADLFMKWILLLVQ